MQIERVRPGTPTDAAPRVAGHSFTHTAELSVWLYRCAPLGDNANPATAAEIEANAQQIHDDADILYRWAFSDTFLAGACDEWAVYDLAGVGPEGGVAGWQLRVAAAL